MIDLDSVHFVLHFSYSHGNQCAGVIAAVANNRLCGVGLAFNAQIAGKLACMCILFEDAWCLSVIVRENREESEKCQRKGVSQINSY